MVAVQPHWYATSIPQDVDNTSTSALNQTPIASSHLYWSAGVASLQVLVLLSSFIAAVLGNSVLLYAFYRSPQVRTLNNMLTLNLAVADVLMALIILPSWMSYLTKGGSNSHTCRCLAFITVLLALTSICSLAAISLDRYLLICHPFDYPQALTYRRLILVVVYIWVHSFVLASLPLLGWGRYQYRPGTVAFCGPDWMASVSFSSVMLVFGFLLPLLIMVVSYTQVFRAASSQAKRIEQIQMQITHPSTCSLSDDEEDPVMINMSRRRSSVLHRLIQRGPRMSATSNNGNRTGTSISRNLKTIRTVFVVVGAFSVCWTPYVILWLWSVVLRERAAYSADFVTTWLALSSGAINPYVFIFLNRDLRYTVRLVLARIEACIPGHDEAPNKVRLSYYGDSIVDSARVVSRSADSGVDLEAAAMALAAEAANGVGKPSARLYKESHLRPPGRAHVTLRDSRKPTEAQEENNPSTDMSKLSADKSPCPDSSSKPSRPNTAASRPPHPTTTRPPHPTTTRPPHPTVTVVHRGSIPIIILPPDN